MKVLLAGNGPRTNRGCEAICITTVEIIRSVWPDAEIEVLSFNPSVDAWYEKELGARVSGLVDAGHKPGIPARAAHKAGIILKGYFPLLPYEKQLTACDMVLSLGGDNYTDDYGSAYLFWEMARLAKRYGKPFVIWGASVGPFSTRATVRAAKSSLRDVAMVTARENETVKYLSHLGYKGEVVSVCDSAFFLKTRQVELPDFGRDAELLGFNISPIYHKYASKAQEEIITTSREIVDALSLRYNVLLVPHVMADYNDAIFMEQLLGNNDFVKMADPAYDSMELKYLISKCDLFIGARTHATIAAFSSGVPTVSLGYSMKARGLNLDIFGHDKYLIEAASYNMGTVTAKVKDVESERQFIKKHLLERQKKAEHERQRIVSALGKFASRDKE